MRPTFTAPRAARLPSRSLRESLRGFVFGVADPYPLGFLRIAVSVVAAVQVVILWPSLLQLYGNFGFVQWAILEAASDTWLPSIGKLCRLIQPFGVSANACVHGVFLAYLIALIFLLVGWRTRFFAVAAWLLHGLTVNSGYISLYGVDTFLHISLFYCIWMPVGASLSLDQHLSGRPPQPSFLANLSLRTLQLHLCIIYFDSGFAKLMGEQWRNGEAIWRVLMDPQFAAIDFSWLAQMPILAKLACWSVLLIEVGYPVFIWPARTRPFWVVATLFLHLGIGAFMGLWMFSIMMMVLTTTAFGIELLRRSEAPTPVRPAGGTVPCSDAAEIS
jgi:hypothetical protein